MNVGNHPSAAAEHREWIDGAEAGGGGGQGGDGSGGSAGRNEAAAASSGAVRTRGRSSTGRFRASGLAGNRGNGVRWDEMVKVEREREKVAHRGW